MIVRVHTSEYIYILYYTRWGEEFSARVGGRGRGAKVSAVYHVLLLLYFVRPFLTLYTYMCLYVYRRLHGAATP